MKKEIMKKVNEWIEDNPYVIPVGVDNLDEATYIANEIYEHGIDYIFDRLYDMYEYEYSYIMQAYQNMIDELELEDNDEIKDYFRENYVIQIDDTDLMNTLVPVRIQIESNYEGYAYYQDPEDSEYLKEILPILEPAIDKRELEIELVNCMTSCNRFTAVFNTYIRDLVDLKSKLQNPKNLIVISKNAIFGLFDDAYGSGSVMEMSLKRDLEIPIQWGQTEYDDISVKIDGDKYGYLSVFGRSAYELPTANIKIEEYK